ncbi:Sestrin-3 like, partial [Actinidia chinensis var. chinensis]
MRTILRSVRQSRSSFQHQGDNLLSGLARQNNYLANTRFGSIYKLSYNAEIHRYTPPSYMISRALFADAAKVIVGDVSKAGPLIEYERRIAARELVDGDS